MDSIEELREISKKTMPAKDRENIKNLGVTLIEDDDVYWIMDWGANHKLVLEGKKKENEIIFKQDQALARLLAEKIIFVQSDKEKKVFNFYVGCNDIFAWACADCEPLRYEDVQSLYDMYIKDKSWGSAKWCCVKRNEQPQGPVINLMKKCGAWDEQMEALKKNVTDKEVHAMFVAAAAKTKP